MKRALDAEARASKVYPIGGGLWIGLHPEFTKQNPTTQFQFDRSIVGLPEANAPKLQMRSSVVTIGHAGS